MTTKTELVDELARLTNEPKVTFKGKSKEKLIILLHETHKRKNYPKRGKHVSFGQHHVTYGSPVRKKRYSGGRARRSSLRPKRSYRTRISSPRRRSPSPRTKISSWKRAYASPRRRNSRRGSRSRSRSRRVRSPTKKYYVDELARITGRTKKYYNSWSKPELEQRLYATKDEHWTPKHGKHVWLSTPPKRSRKRSRRRSPKRSKHVYIGTPPKRRRRSRRKSRSRRRKRSNKKTYKTECKSYQTRVNGICRNKPCKGDKIRDQVTKRCRKKK